MYYLLQQRSDVAAHYECWLSAAERAVLARLRIDKRRADWILGRWTAKRVLSSLPDAANPHDEWTRVTVLAAADGAPEVRVGNRRSAVAISISHCDGEALCVAAPAGAAIGCDLEAVAPRSRAFVETFFTDAERARLDAASAADRDVMTTLIWSAKESVLKALRVSLREDTRGVEVSFSSNGNGAAWRDFDVHDTVTGRRFEGWWRRHGKFVLAMASDPAQPMPERL